MSSQHKFFAVIGLFGLAFVLFVAVRGPTTKDGHPVIRTRGEFMANLNKAKELSLEPLRRFKESETLTDADKSDLRKAAVVFEGLIDYDPLIDRLHFASGQIAHALDNPELAIQKYRQAIQLKPNSDDVDTKIVLADAYDGIAQCLVALRRYDEAIPESASALMISPNHPGYLTTLASAQVQLKQADLARKNLALALKTDPTYERALALQKLLKLAAQKS